MKYTPYRAPPSFQYGNGESNENNYCPNPAFPHFIRAQRRCLSCQAPLLDYSGNAIFNANGKVFPNGNNGPAAYNMKAEACCPALLLVEPTGGDPPVATPQFLPLFDPIAKMCVFPCPNSQGMFDLDAFRAGDYANIGSMVCCPPSSPLYDKVMMRCDMCPVGQSFNPALVSSTGSNGDCE